MKIFKNIVLIVLILWMLFIVKDVYKEDNIRLVNFKNQNISELENYNTMINDKISTDSIKNTSTDAITSSTTVFVPNLYLGHEVDGILRIPKIKLETYVFKEYSEEAMNIAPTKLWGPNINEHGNYSIIGHNYKKENMFNNLIDLKINDLIYLIDNKNGEVKYQVYDIYKVKENNIEPIKQKNKEEVELTLITCVNYTNNRLIVKAKKI